METLFNEADVDAAYSVAETHSYKTQFMIDGKMYSLEAGLFLLGIAYGVKKAAKEIRSDEFKDIVDEMVESCRGVPGPSVIAEILEKRWSL